MKRFHDRRLVRDGISRSRQQKQNTAVQTTVYVVHCQCCYSHATLFGLNNELDDKVKNFVWITLQHTLPEFIHQAAAQVEDVSCHIGCATTSYDRQYTCANQSERSCLIK